MGQEIYCVGSNENMQELIDFADLIFSKNGRPHDFKTMLPKLYGEGVESQPLHYLVKEDGKIMAMVMVDPQTVDIGGRELAIAGLGTVSVHPAARGKGYMKQLMQTAIDDMDRKGYVYCALAGQRQRYEYSGFEPAGMQFHYEVQTANLHHRYRKVDDSPVTFQNLLEDQELLSKALELHNSMPFHNCYDNGQFALRLQSWYNKAYAVKKDGAMIGYCVLGDHGKAVTEYLLHDPQDFPLFCKGLFRQFQLDAVTFILPAWRMDTREIALLSESHILCTHNSFRVRDFVVLTDALMKLKSGLVPLCDGELIIEIKGYQTIRVAVSGGKTEVSECSVPADLVLNQLEATALLFAPDGETLLDCAEALPAFARQWFPLPLSLCPLDDC